MPCTLPPPPLQPCRPDPIACRITVCAHSRMTAYCLARGITQSELVRGLLALGWAQLVGDDINQPAGVPLASAPAPNGSTTAREVLLAH